jgi:hypothetical protein
MRFVGMREPDTGRMLPRANHPTGAGIGRSQSLLGAYSNSRCRSTVQASNFVLSAVALADRHIACRGMHPCRVTLLIRAPAIVGAMTATAMCYVSRAANMLFQRHGRAHPITTRGTGQLRKYEKSCGCSLQTMSRPGHRYFY